MKKASFRGFKSIEEFLFRSLPKCGFLLPRRKGKTIILNTK
jgi:hypothetical protein